MNQTPAVILNVQRQPGANTISVVKSIKQLMPQLQANLPAGINVTTLTDLTTGIQASVADVEFELMLTVVLVVMVIFLFLRSLYATIIPSVAVPLSLVGTFAAMYVLGYSLDNLSLMALTISTGFVVDDAIVMIENISRYHRRRRHADAGGAQGRGADRLHHCVADGLAHRGADSAALHGRRRGPALPRVRRHPGGHHHHFRRGLADADADDVARAFCSTTRRRSRAASTASERVFERMIAFYGRTLKCRSALPDDHPAGGAGTLVLTVFLYIIIPKGFFPVQDTGVIQGISQAPQTISFPGDGGEAAGTGQGHPAGPGGGEPLVVHRRRRHQHHAEQRPHVDQPEAARSSAASAPPT